MVPVHVQWYYTYWYYTYFYWYELVPCLSHLASDSTVYLYMQGHLNIEMPLIYATSMHGSE